MSKLLVCLFKIILVFEFRESKAGKPWIHGYYPATGFVLGRVKLSNTVGLKDSWLSSLLSKMAWGMAKTKGDK